jgi:hypothetical protein
MNKIAFDLDGVIIPDYNIIPNLTDDEFLAQTMYAKPLINPLLPFDVVTARLEAWRDATIKWLGQLTRMPENLYMRPSLDETPAEFKFRIAKLNGYDIYVESDAKICSEMVDLCQKDNHKLVVIHYDTWVIHSLANYKIS